MQVDLVLERLQIALELDRHRAQVVAVEQDALVLHRHQHRHQRDLDGVVDRARLDRRAGLLALLLHLLEQQARQDGALRRVEQELRVARQRLLALAPAGVLLGERLEPQPLERHLGQREVADRSAQQVGEQHRVEQARGDVAAPAGEPQHFLQVVAGELARGIGDPAAQRLDHRVAHAGLAEVGEHDVARLHGLERDAQRRRPDHREMDARRQAGDRLEPRRRRSRARAPARSRSRSRARPRSPSP